MARLYTLAALLAAAAEAAQSKLIVKNTGSEDLAMYFMGSIDDGDMALWDGSETLNDIIQPGATAARYVSFNDSFALRSGDLKWRVRFSLYENDGDEHPRARGAACLAGARLGCAPGKHTNSTPPGTRSASTT